MEEEKVLERTARMAHLREGPAGVAALLRILYHRSPLPTQELARRLGWPVPVVAAVRGELEQAGLLRRTPGGSTLSERGKAFAREVLGLGRLQDPLCPTCAGRRIVIDPTRWGKVLARLEEAHRANPPVDTTLDQSHGLPETALRRVLLMYREGALEGKDVLLLGDDDLVSVAIGLLGCGESPEGEEQGDRGAVRVRRLVVVDVDRRFLEHIAGAGRRWGFAVETVRYDLRDPLPEALQEAFDTVETDPPYTLPGLRLFLSRSLEALRPGGGRDIFLSYAPRDPEGQRALLRECVELGLAPYSVTPDFNRYVATGTLGGSGQFLHLRTAPEARPTVSGRYTGPLYTMEVRPTLRLYRCSTCGRFHRVGPEGDFPTIGHLKTHGCPGCGGKVFHIKRKIPERSSFDPREAS